MKKEWIEGMENFIFIVNYSGFLKIAGKMNFHGIPGRFYLILIGDGAD
jgi:hypothetical protein